MELRITVLVRQTAATPHDGYLHLLEKALRLKDDNPGSRVTLLAVSCGSRNAATDMVMDAVMRGADDGCCIEAGRTAATVESLTEAVVRRFGEPDVLICSDIAGENGEEERLECRPRNAHLIIARKHYQVPCFRLDEDCADGIAQASETKGMPDVPEVLETVEPRHFGAEDADIEALVSELSGLNLSQRGPVVVAGGYGMGSRENFGLLHTLAGLLHAEVGATRAAVDAGFIGRDRMIGQTGITVQPALYIACGISGQMQHMVGVRGNGVVVSVNTDPEAPINAVARYVVTGRVEDVLPKLIEQYSKQTQR